MSDRFDAIIIGAGAAGLAAARDLSRAGRSVCIVEARQRLGGRIWSIHTPDLPLPIELGAEFVHGEVPEMLRIADAAALLVHQLPDNHWWADGGRWELRDEFWKTIRRVLARVPEDAHDVSFAEFLERQRSIDARVQQMAVAFAEGFNAAHAERISAASLRTSADDDEREWKQFRIANGYDAIIEWLRAGIDPERSTIRLGDAARVVSWRGGEVEVRTARGELIRGRSAIVTIPVGVWKEPSAIRFDPPLRAKARALAKLEAGHTVKIVFRFREAFWNAPGFAASRAAKKGSIEGPLNFVHSSDPFMPTWWTTAPVRSPLLTGWAGGNAADRLLTEGHSAIVDRAIDSLASIFAVPRRELDSLLDATWMHDWQADPFSRGSYCYTGVGGLGAHEALARPVASTLFFAGEATTAEQTGTVAGALATGRRSARQCARML